MKNDTKLIMETWRRFLNENNPVDDAPGYHDAYADDMPEDEMGSEVYGVDEEGYGDEGREFEETTRERHGQYFDPEEPVDGPPVPADEDLAGEDVVADINAFESEMEEEEDYDLDDYDSQEAGLEANDTGYEPEF